MPMTVYICSCAISHVILRERERKFSVSGREKSSAFLFLIQKLFSCFLSYPKNYNFPSRRCMKFYKTIRSWELWCDDGGRWTIIVFCMMSIKHVKVEWASICYSTTLMISFRCYRLTSKIFPAVTHLWKYRHHHFTSFLD